jgi:pimeloyl-ACP methyl ester carboxylesterase/tRNA A-37 threonylcarbamoyl transferase component Bud32
MPIPNTLADRYRLDRELGSGGMATVYEARDLRHDRTVAVKVLRPEIYATAGAGRFLREIRIAAQLTHPHILPLIDSGETDGAVFYVMPYVEGETLRARLQRGGELPVPDALRIMRQVLDALAYAHGRGIVHRDIKPENILLSGPYAMVADFGIAKAIDVIAPHHAATVTLTAAGMTLGTPAYMAPEQVAGGPVDVRTDIYACGVVAYEMLAGRLPFRADSAQEVMAAHLAALPEPIATLRPVISPRLAEAVTKAMAKRPSDRWQQASELGALFDSGPDSVFDKGWSDGHAPSAATLHVPDLIKERHFVLSERVCRKLNRATLDPRLIGDRVTYVDNQVDSKVLVFFLHGLGLDHRDFQPILERLPYRGLSPTLVGWEPNRGVRPSLSLADQVVILREWLRDVVHQFGAETVVMVGFSMGADMGFELLAPPPGETAPRIDAFLSLECNLSLETCFVSRVLAGLAPERPETLIADLQRFGSHATTLDEWLNIHEYLVKVLRKYQGDVAPLRDAAAEIMRPFEEHPGFDVFAGWFKQARATVPALRIVFSSDTGSRDALSRLKMENFDRGILGEEFPQDVISTESNADHFDLMAPGRVLRLVDELIAEVRARPRQ